MKYNETVTASSSSGASNVHISDELRVTSGICFSNLTNCNFQGLLDMTRDKSLIRPCASAKCL
jgi:hypothetical protein